MDRFAGHTVILCILGLVLSACQPTSSPPPAAEWEQPWVYTDLRLYDPVDTPAPGADLVAVSTRFAGSSLQLRLDWLDLDLQQDIDLYLALDTGPGGSTGLPIQARSNVQWERLIVIPYHGDIQIVSPGFNPERGLSVNVTRDPLMDEIDVQLRGAGVPGRYPGVRLQVFVTQAGSVGLVDETPIINSNQPTPPPVNVLFTFWNSIPAYTPAQALRRWDGAHSGPLGGRHGLFNLLRAFRNRGLPLTLLDVKWPASLSALDYAGGLPLLQDMARNGLLILPDFVPAAGADTQGSWLDWAQERAASESRKVAHAFGLPASQFLTAPLEPGLPEEYPLIFVPQPSLPFLEPISILRRSEQRLLSIPAYGTAPHIPAQATPGGPAMELRKALAQAAVNTGSPEEMLILGGDLPSSTWGEPTSASATLDYLLHRPWIRILGPNDLLDRRSSVPAGAIPEAQPDPLLEAIRNLTEDSLSKAAWQAYLALYSPVYPTPPALATLRNNYRSQVDALISAAKWEVDCQAGSCPQLGVQCDQGLFCTLASAQTYAVVDLQTGGLQFLFARAETGDIHQLIGPTSQLILGQSDPATWRLDQGLSADPAVIPGGFADETGPYQSNSGPDNLVLVSPGGQFQKRYTLVGNSLRVEIVSTQPFITKLPIIIDPWKRFSPGWGKMYYGEALVDGWKWGLKAGSQVIVHSNGQVTAQEFTDSRAAMGILEDPNYDFPAGHYLVFPLALLDIRAGSHLSVEIQLVP